MVTLPAACPTSAWTATYTVTEVCSGDPSTWHVPDVLPNFDVTTVVCSVCEEPTQVITCPNALGTEAAVVNGNGVTMTAQPTRAPGAPYGPGFGPGEGGRGRHGDFGPGGTEIGSGYGADANVQGGGDPGKGAGVGAGPGYGGGSGASGSGSAAPGGSPAKDGHSPVVTAGAPSLNLKKSLALVTGLAVVVGNLFVL